MDTIIKGIVTCDLLKQIDKQNKNKQICKQNKSKSILRGQSHVKTNVQN